MPLLRKAQTLDLTHPPCLHGIPILVWSGKFAQDTCSSREVGMIPRTETTRSPLCPMSVIGLDGSGKCPEGLGFFSGCCVWVSNCDGFPNLHPCCVLRASSPQGIPRHSVRASRCLRTSRGTRASGTRRHPMTHLTCVDVRVCFLGFLSGCAVSDVSFR